MYIANNKLWTVITFERSQCTKLIVKFVLSQTITNPHNHFSANLSHIYMGLKVVESDSEF